MRAVGAPFILGIGGAPTNRTLASACSPTPATQTILNFTPQTPLKGGFLALCFLSALPSPALPCPALPCPAALPCPVRVWFALPCPALPCPALLPCVSTSSSPDRARGPGCAFRRAAAQAAGPTTRHQSKYGPLALVGAL